MRARPARNPDLHGNVPDDAHAALLLIDVVNDLEFDGGAELLTQALPMAEHLAELKARARAHGVPVLYVNDNFGRWRSDFRRLVEHCLGAGRGRPIVELLQPDEDDYFALKPKHSGFFGTTLDLLLHYLGAQTVIVTGLTTDNCVLFTASDAYLAHDRQLRPVHGERRLSPRLRPPGTRRLRGRHRSGGESGRATPHGARPQGRHASVHRARSGRAGGASARGLRSGGAGDIALDRRAQAPLEQRDDRRFFRCEPRAGRGHPALGPSLQRHRDAAVEIGVHDGGVNVRLPAEKSFAVKSSPVISRRYALTSRPIA